MNEKTISERIEDEMKFAREKYQAFNSTHEIYGVLKEEVDELFDVIKLKNKGPVEIDSMLHELMQIAAIAQRAISEIEKGEVRWI